MSVNAYTKSAQLAADPRQNEHRAFGLVIGKLQSADTPAKLIEAVYMNNRLWNVLATDLAMPTNQLPVDLRARLLSLAVWSQRYGNKVMKGEADVMPLVQVNKEIMAGLRPGGGEPMPVPAKEVAAPAHAV